MKPSARIAAQSTLFPFAAALCLGACGTALELGDEFRDRPAKVEICHYAPTKLLRAARQRAVELRARMLRR